MAKTRRIIRKVNLGNSAYFDDQLWPVICALIVLGGFLVGTVLAFLRVDDPRWYANAWTWLLVVALVLGFSMVALRFLGNRVVRRAMQFSIVICAIVHLMLFLAAVQTKIFPQMWVEVFVAAAPEEPEEVVRVPEYHSFPTEAEDEPQDFETPVETEQPVPQEEEPERPREQQNQEQPTVQTQPVEQPKPEPTVTPNVVRREQPNQVVPRRADEQSRLSRRNATNQAPSTAAVRVPAERTAQDQTRVNVTAARTDVQRQSTTRNTPRRSEQTESTSEAVRAAPRVVRNARSANPQTESTPPSVTRTRTEPSTQPPRTDTAAADQPAVARQTSPTALQPNNTATRRRTTAGPQVERSTTPTAEAPTRVSSRTRPARSQSEPQPNIARAPSSVPNSRPRMTSRPDVNTSAAAVSPAANSVATSGAIAPRATNVARQTQGTSSAQPNAAAATAEPRRSSPTSRVARANPTDAPRADSRSDNLVAGRSGTRATQPAVNTQAQNAPSSSTTPDASSNATLRSASTDVSRSNSPARQSAATASRPQVDNPAASPSTQVARRSTPRTNVATQPSARPQTQPSATPSRSSVTSAVSTSPRAVENPAAAQSSNPSTQTALQPAASALQRGQVGIAGVGSTRNMSRDAPAAESPANVASGSRARARATQTAADGPALAPTEAVALRRSEAGQSAPSSSRQANVITRATTQGQQQPAALDASSAASVQTAMSNADRSTVTAARGASDLDVGPTTIVPSSGGGRAGGGGQPTVASSAAPGAVARTATGGQPEMSLVAERVAADTTAATASGGGQVANLEARPDANAAVRSQSGGNQPVSGGAPGEEKDETPTAVAASGQRSRTESETQEPAMAGIADAGMPGRAQLTGGPGPATSPAVDDAPAVAQADESGAGPGLAAAEPATSRQGSATGTAGQRNDAAASENAAGPAATQIARAELAQSLPGAAAPGGGNAQPDRTSSGPAFEAQVSAETVTMAGAPESSGERRGLDAAVAGGDVTRAAAGDLVATRGPAGSQQGATESPTAEPGAGGIAAARVERAGTAEVGPRVDQAASTGGAARRSTDTNLPFGTTATADAEVVQLGGDAVNGDAIAEAVPGDAAIGVLSRQSGDSLPVAVDAPEGAGGLGNEPTVNVGIRDRRASENSLDVALQAARFNRQDVGGAPSITTRATVSAAPFQRRLTRDAASDDGGGRSRPGPQTEEAIELGLVFLRNHQHEDGRWSLGDFSSFDGEAAMASDSAATALALLAFQGAGYHHKDHQYADVVGRGLRYLVANQAANGDLYQSEDENSNRVVRLYSHSIAALALCEAYGMTQDPELRGPAQKAIDFVVASQHAERGGWRYRPGSGADTSVTGWMMMALKSGELANLEVPRQTYDRIRAWLDRAQASEDEPHLYRYNPYAPNTSQQRQGLEPTKTMTSVGLLMRLYSGWRRDSAKMIRGADFLRENLPAIGTVQQPQRDTYYWYYATQVMFHMKGEYWEDWNAALHPLLVGTQIKEGGLAGSWNPGGVISDRWAGQAGRLYVTTLNLLSLEVYYRHLPLYDETGR